MATGDLAEQRKPLDVGSSVTRALYWRGMSLARRNGEWHHFDPFGTAGVITNNRAQVVSNNVVDLFGVVRYQQGSAEAPWRWSGAAYSEESTYRTCSTQYIPSTATSFRAQVPQLSTTIHCLRGKISKCKWVEGPTKICPDLEDKNKAKFIPNGVDFCKGCVGGPKNCRKLPKGQRLRFSFTFMMIVTCTYECEFDGEECECLLPAPDTSSPSAQ